MTDAVAVYPPGAVIMAPLSGYTDLPFRRACRSQGCRHCFTPLIDAGSVVYRNPRHLELLRRDVDESWLGLQVLGGDPEMLRRAVDQVGSESFAVVDLNLGCPVPKVTRRGCGAALGLDVERAAACVAALVRASRVPVTAKIRILSDVDPAPTTALACRLADAGVQALTVHGRIWERIYSGPVRGDMIAAVQASVTIPVIANGGIFSRADAAELVRASGCDRLMIARGAIGNPWIFRELDDDEAPPPTHTEVMDMLVEHVEGMLALYGEDRGIRNARKIILAYLKGRGYRRPRRAAVTSLATAREFREFAAAVRAEGPSSTVDGD